MKLVLCGPTQSGKSSIIDRYMNYKFNQLIPNTIGLEFTERSIKVGGIKAKFQIVK